jgi:hypothetical protein
MEDAGKTGSRRGKRQNFMVLTMDFGLWRKMTIHIATGKALPADQRERGFGAMVGIALATAFAA